MELMQSVDPLQYHDDIMKNFDKLLKIDAYRSGYYRDLSMSVSMSQLHNHCSL